MWLLLYHAGGGRARGKLKFIVPIPARRFAAGCGAKNFPRRALQGKSVAKLLLLFLDFIQLGVDLQDLLLGKQAAGHHAHALDGEALAHVNQALVDF